MEEKNLTKLPLGTCGYISRCLSPFRDDVYRLLEMGLCSGARFTILQKGKAGGALELALEASSRLCIDYNLAGEFLAITPKTQKAR
jgi:hypothetical protein